MASVLLGRVVAFRLCLHDRFPSWQARRRAEGRLSGYSAFVWLYANPLMDGQGFGDWRHVDNRSSRGRYALVAIVFFVLFLLFFTLLIIVAHGFGTK